MDLEAILYTKEDGVATITLNRPDRRNAINRTMALELRKVWEAINADPEVVAVIVTGAGEKSFCSGADVSGMADGSNLQKDESTRENSPFFHITAIHNKVWKPVITAVNGYCCGGGLHFVADSDLVICSDTATFFDTHVKVGLVAGLEPVGLARRIPLEQVLRMALLGGSERMDAQTALHYGLVGEVLPAEDLLTRAKELAGLISQHSPTALARTKQTIWESIDTGLDEALTNTWNCIQEHNKHPDLREGPMSFMEKRKPRWEPYKG